MQVWKFGLIGQIDGVDFLFSNYSVIDSNCN